MPERRLTRNAAQCGECQDVVESTHRHDFRRCSCGNVFVDGGLAYNRVGFKTGNWIDLCEYEVAA